MGIAPQEDAQDEEVVLPGPPQDNTRPPPTLTHNERWQVIRRPSCNCHIGRNYFVRLHPSGKLVNKSDVPEGEKCELGECGGTGLVPSEKVSCDRTSWTRLKKFADEVGVKYGLG